MWQYEVFGLNVQSELEIPEWRPGNQPTDVIIRFAEIPPPLTKPDFEKSYYQLTDTIYRTTISGIADFWVENGREICIQRAKFATDAQLRLFLLDRILAVLLQQRQLLPLRASSIHTQNGTVLLTGSSRYATAMLPGSLQANGYQLQSSFLSCLNKEAQLLPGYNFLYNAPLPVREGNPQLRQVLELVTEKTASFHAKALSLPDGFRILKENVVCPEGIQSSTRQQWLFRFSVAVAPTIAFTKISIPTTNFSYEKLVHFIEQVVQGK